MLVQRQHLSSHPMSRLYPEQPTWTPDQLYREEREFEPLAHPEQVQASA
ncbi:MAG: hypothetical protein RMJ19_03775 [Gemmatales bacterium]|nr:hypothetical protein [Gemmatales bacterium]MDW8174765.1 hypothetical protein [Gemmatales bacterium]MDW8223487.1 hypothetical protein [Gemmatales bacterium]